MKYLLPLLILIFAFTAFGYNQTSFNNWLTINEFSIEDAKINLGNIEYNQADDCTITISPTSTSLSYGGTGLGESSFNVQAPIGCQWQAITNDSWITITNNIGLGIGKGVGNGTVTYTVAENKGNPRTGTITVGNQTFTINQGTHCYYSGINPTNSMPFSPSGGSGSFYVQPAPFRFGYSCSMTATSDVPWVTVTGNGPSSFSYVVAPNDGPARTGVITITIANGQVLTHTIYQEAVIVYCPNALNPTGQNIGASGGSSSITVTGPSSCSWTATSNVPWITFVGSVSGTGNGTINFSVASNTGVERSGTITVGNRYYNITQSSGCSFSLSPTSQNVSAEGGSGGFTITSSNSGCSWTATKSASWITLNTPSGTGNGSVSFVAQANTGPARTGTITVGGQIFTINQAGTCTYTLTPATKNLSASGGTESFTVNSATDCSWTAASNVPWITITSGSSGSGSGTVNFSVQANTGVARSGTITAGGQTFTVNQAADSICTYSLSSTSVNISASGGTGTVNVTTDANCSWSALSNVPWITTFANGNNTGNGTITFSVEANSGPARTGTITVAGKTFTVNQANGCTYTLSSTSASIRASGDTGTVNVTAQHGCNWGSISNVSWITLTGISIGSGSGWVNFFVAPNTGPARTGTITIADQTFVVNQANGCTYSISRSEDFIEAGGGGANFSVSAGQGCAWTAVSNNSWITIGGNPNGSGNGSVSYTVEPNTGVARTGSITVAGITFTVNQQAVVIPQRRTFFDFDGDGKSDFSIYRPEAGEWWYLRSSDGGNAAAQFGTSTDKIVPADYTGDGKTDFAFYRKGEWFILRSEDFSYYAFPFGLESDIPVPADYDGDGKADAAVFRPSTSVWYILKSTGGVRIEQFGTGENIPVDQFAANGDVPIPADYNGDGKTDLAVYNNTTNNWRIRTANSETSFAIFRANTYKAVPADYTGDGKADIALYDTVTNDWLIIRSENQSSITVKFGTSGDIPVPADYDGDGKSDLAIYRPSTSDWWYAASSANGQQRARRFGISTDIPVPSAYVPQ